MRQLRIMKTRQSIKSREELRILKDCLSIVLCFTAFENMEIMVVKIKYVSLNVSTEF